MKIHACILAMAFVVLTSCYKKGASEAATDHFLEFEAVYQGEDVRQTESGLLNYRQEIVEARQQGKRGIDFDQALAIADARLFVLYETVGRTNKAEEFFHSSVDAFKRVAAKAQREPPEFSRAALRDTVEKFDRGLNVRWREPKTR